MFGETRTTRLKKNADAGAAAAAELARDRKFRGELLAALRHGAEAQDRVKQGIGRLGVLNRLAADEDLRRELRAISKHLRKARARIEKKRSHKLRNTIVLAGGASAVAAVPKTRKLLGDAASSLRPGPRAITETIDVDVPVSTAYNQWTQFEEFPRFMEGVESVRQLDDTRLHWVATVAGKPAEWNAKILEQQPDRHISWISEDGRATRGNVTFDELTPSRTRVELSMSYRAEGVREAIGSAAGLDRKRVRGDLQRFRDMIENRGRETGAWRGTVAGGKPGETS